MNDPQRLVGILLLGLDPLLVSTVDGELVFRLGGVVLLTLRWDDEVGWSVGRVPGLAPPFQP